MEHRTRGAWEELDPAAQGLPEARLELHHAVQLAAAGGDSLAPRAPDDSQQSLAPVGDLWLGAPLAGRWRLGIDPRRLEVLVCREPGEREASLALPGRTMAEGLAFLRAELERRGVAAGGLALPRHPADFPDHPVARGAAFSAGGAAARSLLAALHADTALLLSSSGLAGAAPLRIWPHHLDLAASRTVGGTERTMTMGASPGDGPAGRPYWYATLWPEPPRASLPPLRGGGRWRTEGWAGAELPLEHLGRGARAQAEQLEAFFRSALAAARPAAS